jgi:YfiH family protein
MDLRVRALVAILGFGFRIYSMEKPNAETLDGVANSLVLDYIDADTGDHRPSFMLQVKRQDQITFVRSEVLDSMPGIVHAFSTRRGERDDFCLAPFSSPDPIIRLNRIRFLAAIGAPGWPILRLKQVHSGIVRDMDDTSAANEPLEGDAAITDVTGVLLGIQTADCVPILIAGSTGRCIAAIHAGWRGTAKRIVERTVKRLTEKYGVPTTNLTAVIGPHIGVCCYEVGEDVVEAIHDPAVFQRRADWSKPHLDLGEANRRQLCDAGLSRDRVVLSTLCTRCRSDLFFSHRREGNRAGRMLSVIGIEP